MPFVDSAELRVHHVLSGPADAPLVVLSHSLGTSLALWEPQWPALSGRLRVLSYDMRGHGRTSVPPGPYTIDQLGGDVLRLLDALGIARAHFCGLSVGGLIGMWLGAHAPERVGRLVLCNTAARLGSPEAWNARIESVRRDGMQALVPIALERWFTAVFRQRAGEVVASAARMLEATPPEGYAACCAAIRDADQRRTLAAIRAPTLVIAGREDPAAPAADGRLLAQAIPGAEYVELAASHLSNLEAPEAFNRELMRFLLA